MSNKNQQRIILTGGAGLLGQNLIILLKKQGYTNLLVIDKQAHNLAIAEKLHPDIDVLCGDLSQPGPWQKEIIHADVIIMLQAQISAADTDLFYKNSVLSTELILNSAKEKKPYIVHVSSSVVNSKADDHYVRSKYLQEKLVRESSYDWVILRPTLMFGHFDRKHLGWLSRFMRKSPVFPIPGDGKFIRQPLYAIDFCRIIESCIQTPPDRKTYAISGKEKISYQEIIHRIKSASNIHTLIINIPYTVFYWLLKTYALFDKNPPFTVSQLEALIIDETFELIDWENIFGIEATPLNVALSETFSTSNFSEHVLEF